MTWRGDGAKWALAGAVLALGGLSLGLGQDINFDLLNYHYYDGYAFLHGRLSRDVVPAGLQTFQPPVLYAFEYLGIAHLSPRAFGFLVGVLQGLNVPVLFLLGLSVLPEESPRSRTALALLAALLGATGPAAVSMLGTTFGDTLVSVPGLLALVLVLRQARQEGSGPGPGLAGLFWAGLLAGAATGLKLTMGLYHVALAAAALWVLRGRRSLAKGVGLFALGSVVGFLPTGGFWCWTLFERFGNPVFPWANALFRSPFYQPDNFRFERFAARTPYDLVRPAFDTALGRAERLQEIGLRDGRLLVLLVVLVLYLIFLGLGRLLGRAGVRGVPLGRAEQGLLLYWLVAYLIWARAFYYYRYFAVLEFTAPLVAVFLLRRLVPKAPLVPVLLLLGLGLVLTTRSGSWGRRPWQEDWLQLPIPALGLQPNALVLLVGQPISFVIPSFPEEACFVHLTAVDAFGAPRQWKQRIAGVISGHRGPFLLLSNFQYSRATGEARAAEFGLLPTPRCEPIQRGPLRFRLCELQRAPQIGRGASAP